MRIYVDSSALAKRYIEEPGSDAVARALSRASALGSVVTLVPEIMSAFCRLRRAGTWSESAYESTKAFFFEDVADLELVQLNERVVKGTVDVLERHDVRAMDALHVSAALAWRTDVFLSADRRQMEAAAGQGLETVGV